MVGAAWGKAMQFKSIPWWVWLVPIVMLFIATERMPYGYYTFTRIVVCGFAALLAYVAWEEETTESGIWAVILALVAVLFNPIVPVYLKRATWAYFDVGTAILFFVHWAFVRLRWLRAKQS